MRSKSPSATVAEASQANDPVLTRGGMEMGQYLAQQEHNPAIAAAMASMRQRIAAVHPTGDLAALRQRKGLSQAQLAAALDTSQAVIALWEKDPTQMTSTHIQRMAQALQVSEQEIQDARHKAPTSARAHTPVDR